MKEESLQLVTYDGQQIPSGYLFGDISARLAITYLKSINASEDAIDKVKEVEVNKILYGLGVLKSSTGKTHYRAKGPDGEYGVGTGRPVPGHIISAYKAGGTPTDWTVTEVDDTEYRRIQKESKGKGAARRTSSSAATQRPSTSTPQQPQQVPQTTQAPQILGNTSPSGPTHMSSNIPAILSRVGPETTSDITQVSGDVYKVSLEGKKPNIAMNMLTLMRRYSPNQAIALEKFLLSGGKNGKEMNFDLSDIPLEIRDEILEWVTDSSRNFMQIHEKLNRISKVELEYSEPISDDLKKKFGLNVSQDMEAVFKGLNIADMFNSGVLGIYHIENVFPVLAEAMRANMELNNSDKVSEDFEVSSEMFVVPWDFPKEKVTASLNAIAEAIKTPNLSLSEFVAKFTNKKKGNLGPSELGGNLLPVFNIILNGGEPSEVVDELAKYITGLDKNPRREEFIKLVEDTKVYLEKTLNGTDQNLPTVEELKDTTYSKLHRIPLILDGSDFPARKEPQSSMFVDIAIAMAKESQTNKDNSKYIARKQKGDLRQNNLLERIATLPTSDNKSDSNDALSQKRNRAVKAFKAATTLSIAGFTDGNKESTFVSGQKAFYSAHEALSQWSGGFEPLDFVGFMRMSPLLMEGDSIVFIDDNCEVQKISIYSSDEDKEKFASNVYQSLNKMIDTDIMDSDRAAYAMLAITKPSLIDKFEHKPDSTDHLTNSEAQKVYKSASKATSSFITKLIDPIMGNSRIQNGVGGKSITGHSKYKEFRDKYPDLHSVAEQVTLTGSGSATINGTTTSFSSPAEFEVFMRNLVASELGVDPKKITLTNDKITTSTQLAGQMVKSYMTLGQFNVTMTALSNPDFVDSILLGTSSKDSLQKMFPGISDSMLSSIKIPDMSDLTNTLTETFSDHVDSEAKMSAVRSFLRDAIVKGSSEEMVRRQSADPFSASQLSEIYEAISATGNFISQLAQYKDFKIFPNDDSGGGPIGSLMDTGSKIQLGKGDTPSEHFVMGTRASTEKGSHIDAINSRVSNTGGVRSIAAGFLEFKFISSGTRAAHLQASSTPLRDIAEALDNYDKISLDPVLNITNVIDSPESSDVYDISWNCHVGAETNMSNDGNRAHARRTHAKPKKGKKK